MDTLLNDIVTDSAAWAEALGSEQDILELAANAKSEGLIQPVVVEQMEDGRYRVIAGHMRVEACERLGWRSLPAIVRIGPRG